MLNPAVLYARVSSKDQEREGFSIPAQLDLLRSYAAGRQFKIAKEFVDVETAKQAGRAAFSRMVAFAKKHSGRLLVLVEKTDRLYRNLRDWVTIDELNVEIHLVKENVVLSPESRSHEKFMHGIKVLMAKNYVENLGEETKKGMAAKAKQGVWPSFAPPGYRNVVGPDGKRTIEPDPDDAPVITRLFERFACGNASIKMLAREFPTIRGRRFFPAQIHQALRKRIYTGDFDFDGITYRGTHTPLVSRETWERVQAILDGRTSNKSGPRGRQFTLTGLIQCGNCGCLMVGELKKRRYTYYHCTEGRGQCSDPYVREEQLLGEVARTLKQLVIAPATLSWLRESVVEYDKTEAGARAEALKRLKGEHARLRARIETMYLDRLDGRITAEFFDQKSKEWHDQQKEIEGRMLKLETTVLRSATEAVQIMKSVSDSCARFPEAQPEQQRAIARSLLKNATWKAGKFESALKSPFDVLALSNSVSQRKDREINGSGREIEIWLPGMDSNHEETSFSITSNLLILKSPTSPESC
jgi:DNA invertase Pin-like site-specific DNA recombinase